MDEYFSTEDYPQDIIKSIIADNGSKFSTLGEYLSNVVEVYFVHSYSAFDKEVRAIIKQSA